MQSCRTAPGLASAPLSACVGGVAVDGQGSGFRMVQKLKLTMYICCCCANPPQMRRAEQDRLRRLDAEHKAKTEHEEFEVGVALHTGAPYTGLKSAMWQNTQGIGRTSRQSAEAGRVPRGSAMSPCIHASYQHVSA